MKKIKFQAQELLNLNFDSDKINFPKYVYFSWK